MEKKYKNGFCAGVFDMFHIGHLNLLERASQICEHLTVGIVVDEIPMAVKGKKPYIPIEERVAIVQAIRYVDEVVILEHPLQIKKHSWEKFKYDAFISGDDWATNPAWLAEQEWLRSVGSDLVFLSYTKGRTSTELRAAVGFNDKVLP